MAYSSWARRSPLRMTAAAISGVAPMIGGEVFSVNPPGFGAEYRAYRPVEILPKCRPRAVVSWRCVNAPARARISVVPPPTERRLTSPASPSAELGEITGRALAAAAFAAVQRLDEATEEVIRAGMLLRTVAPSIETARLHAELCAVSCRLGYRDLAEGHRRAARSMLPLFDSAADQTSINARLATEVQSPAPTALSAEIARLDRVAADRESLGDAAGVAAALRHIIRLTSGQRDDEHRLRLDGVDARVRLELIERERDDLRRRSLEDPLTGLANRRAIEERLPEIVSGAACVTLAVIDVDCFKSVNDDYSHQVGDDVLRGVARLLARHCRSEDLVARLGGDEFVVAFVGLSAKRAGAILERLRTSVADSCWDLIAPGLRVSVSVGAAYAQSGISAEVLMGRADQALRGAKQSGRDRVRLARQETHRASAVRNRDGNRIRATMTHRNEHGVDPQPLRLFGDLPRQDDAGLPA